MLRFEYSPSKLAISHDDHESLKKSDLYFEQFLKTIQSESIGFFRMLDSDDHINSCQRIFNHFKQKKNFVLIGIGGSSLGPEMLIKAIPNSPNVNSSTITKARKFYFINNIDPDHIADIIEPLDMSETLFYVVSKSGGTAETIAGLSIVINRLKSANVEESEFKDCFVFATDPKQSQLLTLANKLEIQTLEIPSNVGGRFSVLSPVGLLPAIFKGMDINFLYKGAREIKATVLKPKGDIQKYANFIWKEYLANNSLNVLMPYSSKLRDFSFWYVQLWAESLGKQFNRQGQLVKTGLTPIPGYGATDQHSQMQLFMEGPEDKVLQLIEVEKFEKDFSLENNYNELASFQKLQNHSLAKLMKAELEGTKKALHEMDRPFINTIIPKLDEFHLGELIVFYECLTALMGEYFEIDAFNQPGVELGKKYAFEYLNLPD